MVITLIGFVIYIFNTERSKHIIVRMFCRVSRRLNNVSFGDVCGKKLLCPVKKM